MSKRLQIDWWGFRQFCDVRQPLVVAQINVPRVFVALLQGKFHFCVFSVAEEAGGWGFHPTPASAEQTNTHTRIHCTNKTKVLRTLVCSFNWRKL